MNNWGKVAAGVVLGVAGTIYATSEEARKNLPKTARDLPVNVRRRYKNAVSAAREASSSRREEILRDLEQHDRAHAGRAAAGAPEAPPAEPQPAAGPTVEPATPRDS
ncbi:MAG: hypothetical protein WKF95_18935 [Rubrobacter sp.]